MGTYSDLSKLKRPAKPSGIPSEIIFSTPLAESFDRQPSQETNARMPDFGQSGMTERKIALLPERPIAGKPEIMQARSMAESVYLALDTKAAQKESFRFPLELIDELEDIPHELRKTHQKRLSKTAIFVAALAAYLWDFRHNGEKSQLYQQLIEQKS